MPDINKLQKRVLFLFLLSLFYFLGTAQNYNLLLQNQVYSPPENFNEFVKRPDIQSNELVNGYYYRLLQFYNIPNTKERKRLEAKGIELLEYLPNSTYLAAIPSILAPSDLSGFGIRSIIPIPTEAKIGERLRDEDFGDWAVKGEMIKIQLQYFKNLPIEQVELLCYKNDITIESTSTSQNTIMVWLNAKDLETIASFNFVQFLENIPGPILTDDFTSRNLHRSNVIDSDYATGIKYNGDGIRVLIRDDGLVDKHIDFQGRILDQLTELNGGINHADWVSGAFGGAGNLDPTAKGIADGVDLFVMQGADEDGDFSSSLVYVQNENVVITNSSLSEIGFCNVYNITAQTVDQQIQENEQLLHVFSAGNSQLGDCGYGAGPDWANITGGHKNGKNALTVGSLNKNNILSGFSSVGPAHDGRIKPDICGLGEDVYMAQPNNTYSSSSGTSFSAPALAGVVAQLYHAYEDLNNGILPSSGLVKASILNSATDLGNTGPDYRHGWGLVNAHKAFQIIQNNNIISDEIDQGVQNIHQISVPSDVTQLRILVYWEDVPSTPMTSKALINNLDLSVLSPGGNNNLPWILDPTPNSIALNTPATTGIDSINNVEQVSLENPESGTYEIIIDGTEIPFGPQNYHIVYQFYTNEITVTHPIGGEGFEPFTGERIHWDAYGNDGDFTIEYSIDNGAFWNFIATVSGDTRMYDWSVPGSTTGKALVRVSRDNESDTSDANFSIAYVPSNISVTQVCPDYVQIVWPPTFGATSYDVFVLGEKYMDSIATTNVPFLNIPVQFPLEDFWFAVQAKGPDGMRSRRSIAVQYDGLLQDCQQNNDLALVSINEPNVQTQLTGCDPYINSISVTITNEGLNAASNFPVGYRLNDLPAISEMYTDTLNPGESIDYVFTEQITIDQNGTNTIKTWVGLSNENFTANDTSSLNIDALFYTDLGNGEALDLTEDFEGNTFPSDYWQILDPDDTQTWSKFETTGAIGDTTQTIRVPNYSYNAVGQEDIFQTILIDLTNATTPILSFDYAYTFYQAGYNLVDSLRIDISTDCGDTFDDVLFYEGGEELATVPGMSGFFVPQSADDWQTKVLDLTPYIGSSVLIRFVNINGWGNNMHLDNINILNIIPPQAGMLNSDTTICENNQILFQENAVGIIADYSWNFGSGTNQQNATGPGPHEVFFLEPGVNTVSLVVSNAAGSDSTSIEITVDPNPTADFTSNDLGDGIVEFTNNAEFGTSFLWDFGDDNTSTEENPTHTYSENGNYTVTLTVTNDCGEKVAEETINVIVVSTQHLQDHVEVNILPNPSFGAFQVQIDGIKVKASDISLMDLQGKTIGSISIDEHINGKKTTFSINGNQLAKGVYLLKINSTVGSITKKVVIQ